MMLAIDYTPSEKLVASFRYQRKLTDERGDQVGLPVDRQLQQRARLEMEYRLSTRVQMRCRVERVFLDWKNTSVKEKGFLMYHDVSVRSSRRLRWNTRLVFFQTDSFDSRMYEYERDLDGVVSVPSLSGTGIRWYGVLRYQIGGHVEISAKYSDIIRDDVKHLGSGLDELPANHDNRINVQLDVTL